MASIAIVGLQDPDFFETVISLQAIHHMRITNSP